MSGRRLLFDTGNDAKLFPRNVKRLQIDRSRLDAVVISLRHGDLASGLSCLLFINPKVTIYTPQEGALQRLEDGWQGRSITLPCDSNRPSAIEKSASMTEDEGTTFLNVDEPGDQVPDPGPLAVFSGPRDEKAPA